MKTLILKLSTSPAMLSASPMIHTAVQIALTALIVAAFLLAR